jgi:hypothetical protein
VGGSKRCDINSNFLWRSMRDLGVNTSRRCAARLRGDTAFDSQQRGLRPRCLHWSSSSRYKLASVVAFNQGFFHFYARCWVSMSRWCTARLRREATSRGLTARAEVALLRWHRQREQQSRLTRANPEISILPGSSLRHTKSSRCLAVLLAAAQAIHAERGARGGAAAASVRGARGATGATGAT